MSQEIEPKRGRGRPPLVIDMEMFATFAELQANYKQIAGAFKCSERTIQIKMKQPEFQEAYEQGRERGKLNLKQLQWNHARGLDYKGNPVKNPGSGPVSMTIHLSKQAAWLGESDKASPLTMIQNNNTLALSHASESDLIALEAILTRIEASASQGRIGEEGNSPAEPTG